MLLKLNKKGELANNLLFFDLENYFKSQNNKIHVVTLNEKFSFRNHLMYDFRLNNTSLSFTFDIKFDLFFILRQNESLKNYVYVYPVFTKYRYYRFLIHDINYYSNKFCLCLPLMLFDFEIDMNKVFKSVGNDDQGVRTLDNYEFEDPGLQFKIDNYNLILYHSFRDLLIEYKYIDCDMQI